MRKKRMTVIALTVVLVLAFSFSSFAGEWKQEGVNWQYRNTNGSCLTSGWYWINGACYYFNSEGYCLMNTVTPDGYTVDSSGAWVVDGTRQIQPTEIIAGTITARIPNGYSYVVKEDDGMKIIGLMEENGDGGLIILCMQEEGISGISLYYGMEGVEYVSDRIVTSVMEGLGNKQVLINKDTRDFETGHWYHYNYTIVNGSETVIPCEAYISFAGDEMRSVFLPGNVTREFIANDDFIQNYIK